MTQSTETQESLSPACSGLLQVEESFFSSEYQSQMETLNKPPQTSIWVLVANSARKVTDSVGGVAIQAGNTVAGGVTETANIIGEVAAISGSAIVTGATGVGERFGNIATTVGSTTLSVAKKVPEGLGHLVSIVTDNPSLRLVTKHLKIDDLLSVIIERVDVVKVESQVKQLQAKYPDESPDRIVHRIIIQKVLFAGSAGFASSFFPGTGASLFALDLTTTLALQAEMAYQIAAAYGLDLSKPARKGEVLLIFGLTLGSNSAIKAGLGFARNMPTVGAVIGASSNAVLLYTLGKVACKFYSAQVSCLSYDSAIQV